MNNIEKVSGFKLCEFKSDGDDYCNHCDKEIEKGSDVYFERTSYEYDEGEYYCGECSLKMPSYWENMDKDYADYIQDQQAIGGAK